MELMELETKEDIVTVGLLARKVASSVLIDGALTEYLDHIEQKIRQNMENDVEYYIIYSQGPVGWAALINQGDWLKITEIGILPSHRRKGLFKRFLTFAAETYDPPLIKIDSWGQPLPALEALGFAKNETDYEKRFYQSR